MGLFDFISGGLGTKDNFQANTPYSGDVLNQQLGNQQQLYGQQQQLAQALLNQSNGQGPNPAQMQYQQNVNQAIQNSAGMMAGQRGINPGLAARMASQNAAQQSQVAAGNAATLQAQQQLGAQAQLGGLYGQMSNQGFQQQGLYDNTFMNAQKLNADVAANNQKTNAGLAGGMLNAIGPAVGMLAGGGGGVGALGGMGAGSGALAGGAADAGGVSAMDAAPLLLASRGGSVEAPNPKIGAVEKSNRFEGAAYMPEHLQAMAKIYHTNMASGGVVPAMVSPGEVYLPPDKAQAVADGQANPIKSGEKIPGKAKVAGDSQKNDTVPKDLEEGGVVIPKSVMESANPEKEAAKFVADHIRKSSGSKKNEGEFREALKRAIAGRKNK